jgi:hypothetical protein
VVRPRDAEWPNQFPQAYDLEILVNQNEIEGEQHADSVYRIRWDNPDATILRKRLSA